LKKPVYDNPFDDLFFWLNIAAIDFGLFEDETKVRASYCA